MNKEFIKEIFDLGEPEEYFRSRNSSHFVLYAFKVDDHPIEFKVYPSEDDKLAELTFNVDGIINPENREQNFSVPFMSKIFSTITDIIKNKLQTKYNKFKFFPMNEKLGRVYMLALKKLVTQLQGQWLFKERIDGDIVLYKRA